MKETTDGIGPIRTYPDRIPLRETNPYAYPAATPNRTPRPQIQRPGALPLERLHRRSIPFQ